MPRRASYSACVERTAEESDLVVTDAGNPSPVTTTPDTGRATGNAEQPPTTVDLRQPPDPAASPTIVEAPEPVTPTAPEPPAPGTAGRPSDPTASGTPSRAPGSAATEAAGRSTEPAASGVPGSAPRSAATEIGARSDPAAGEAPGREPESAATKTGGRSTDPAVPDPAVPEPAVPEPAVPDPAVPDPAVADPAVADPAVADPAVPDPAVPDPAVPDPAVPDPAVPDPAVAEPAVPEPAVPDPAVPEPAATEAVGRGTVAPATGNAGRLTAPAGEVEVGPASGPAATGAVGDAATGSVGRGVESTGEVDVGRASGPAGTGAVRGAAVQSVGRGAELAGDVGVGRASGPAATEAVVGGASTGNVGGAEAAGDVLVGGASDPVATAAAPATQPEGTVAAPGRLPRPGRRVVAAGLVVLLVAAVLTGLDAWFRHRRTVDLDAVTTAFADADCGAALEAWQQSTQDPAFPGRRVPTPAGVDGAVATCRALEDADRLRDAGDAERSFAAYLALRRSAPESPIARTVIGQRLVAVLDGGAVTARPRLCRDLRGAVEAGLLAEDDAVPRVMTACGELLARADSDADRATAFVLVSAVREHYPKAPDAPRAATVEAGLRLAAARDAPHTATTPFLAAPRASGAATVRFVNHSPWPVTLTVKGPGGGRVVRLRACPSCGPYLRDISFSQCMGKGASTRLSLPPGRFEIALQYDGDGPDPSHGYWNLQPGAYEECYFYTR